MPAELPPRERAGRLRLARLAHGLSQEQLARVAGVTRQAVAGIETGRWDPSLRVALRLAGALGVGVEALFGPPAAPPPEPVELVGAPLPPGRRLRTAVVGERRIGFPLTGVHGLAIGFEPASAVVVEPGPDGRALAAPLLPGARTLVVAGCDPALALLRGPLERGDPSVELLWWPCGTDQALELLRLGLVHGAGVHGSEGEWDARAEVWRGAAPGGVDVVGFAGWREGWLWHPGLDGPVSAAAVAERRLPLVNREPGAEARRVLDRECRRAGIDPASLAGYHAEVGGHLPVAAAVASGLGAVGIATEPAALAFGLAFAALTTERSDLLIPRALQGTLEVQALYRVLGGPALPRQLGAVAGYDASVCGQT
ncbi:MAG TPA: substrate-binding domain-containing protein [Candidatus Dormibacteraeota bacterium]|nr:substrate-binding domain-containing protein [Candidatus Dormibacteraeota bacterium]